MKWACLICELKDSTLDPASLLIWHASFQSSMRLTEFARYMEPYENELGVVAIAVKDPESKRIRSLYFARLGYLLSLVPFDKDSDIRPIAKALDDYIVKQAAQVATTNKFLGRGCNMRVKETVFPSLFSCGRERFVMFESKCGEKVRMVWGAAKSELASQRYWQWWEFSHSPSVLFSSKGDSAYEAESYRALIDLGINAFPILLAEYTKNKDSMLMRPIKEILMLGEDPQENPWVQESLMRTCEGGSRMGAKRVRFLIQEMDAAVCAKNVRRQDLAMKAIRSLGLFGLPEVFSRLEAGDDRMLQVVRSGGLSRSGDLAKMEKAELLSWWRDGELRHQIPVGTDELNPDLEQWNRFVACADYLRLPIREVNEFPDRKGIDEIREVLCGLEGQTISGRTFNLLDKSNHQRQGQSASDSPIPFSLSQGRRATFRGFVYDWRMWNQLCKGLSERIFSKGDQWPDFSQHVRQRDNGSVYAFLLQDDRFAEGTLFSRDGWFVVRIVGPDRSDDAFEKKISQDGNDIEAMAGLIIDYVIQRIKLTGKTCL